jgi:rhamnose transport system permease protein
MKQRFPPAIIFRHEAVIAVLLLMLLVVAGYCIPGFLSLKSQILLSRQLWETAILALGMTAIIISGGIDLSVGSVIGLSAIVFAFTHKWSDSLILSCCCCVLSGAFCGACNGILISRWKIHPLIVTLATGAVFRGVAEGISQGQSSSGFGDDFSTIARGTFAGIPLPGLVFLVLTAIFWIWLTRTPSGRFFHAIGFNEEACLFSGVPVSKLKFRLYVTSGLLAGIATVIYVSRFDTARADAGRGLELDVITAVVVGGTSIFGGRGSIPGTILGVLLIHEMRLFTVRFWKNDELRSVAVGSLLIGAVLIYQFLRYRSGVASGSRAQNPSATGK